jgi:hypothetical protein
MHHFHMMCIDSRSLTMSALTEEILKKPRTFIRPPHREISRFSPVEIRTSITELVERDRLDLAMALSDAGISLYPDSEEILAISALLAQMQQNWSLSCELFEQLVTLQQGHTPAAVLLHWARSLRCHCEPEKAREVLEAGLKVHPLDLGLKAEWLSVCQQLEGLFAIEGNAQHQ